MSPTKATCAIAGAAVMAAFSAAAAPAAAQQDTPAPGIDLTLNRLSPASAGGCRLTFVIRNHLDAPIDKLVFETVLFDGAGQVATLTLFDFGSLPESRPRVRQFDVADLPCADIGQVLVNGIGTCEGADLAPERCLEGLRLSSDADTEVLG